MEFDYLIKTQNKLLFKFSDHDEELSDEIQTINHNKSILNVGKFIYEFFILKIPIKRLHPSLKNEDNIDNFVQNNPMVFCPNPTVTATDKKTKSEWIKSFNNLLKSQ